MTYALDATSLAVVILGYAALVLCGFVTVYGCFCQTEHDESEEFAILRGGGNELCAGR